MNGRPDEGEVHVTGHCYCGTIAFEVRIPSGSKPIFTAYCHCASCRRAHAAPLYQVACVEESMFRITAGQEHLKTFSKTETSVCRAFCDVCGSKVLNRFPGWRPDGRVPVAFFPSLLKEEVQHALPELLRPSKHAWRDETVLDPAVLSELLR